MKPYKRCFEQQPIKLSESLLSAVAEFDTHTPSDEQVIRTIISAEQGAINLYQQLLNYTRNPILRKVIIDITKEEKIHVAEMERVLKQYIVTDEDNEYEIAQKGYDEVDELADEIL